MDKCPRCRGNLIIEDDEISCLQCGHRPNPIAQDMVWNDKRGKYELEVIPGDAATRLRRSRKSVYS